MSKTIIIKYDGNYLAIDADNIYAITCTEAKIMGKPGVVKYSVEVYTLSDEMIEAGRAAWKKAFSDYELYMTTGIVRDHIWDEFAEDGSKIL